MLLLRFLVTQVTRDRLKPKLTVAYGDRLTKEMDRDQENIYQSQLTDVAF